MPLFRRVPKRGFNNANFRRSFSIVNVGDLERCFEDLQQVTPQLLVEKGLVRNLRLPVKVLGDGQLGKKLTVEAHKFSKQAADKIQAVGGQVKLV